ncbi:class I SAM-dependent DNA methyltransferase [Tepidibacter thalassicus]|uniref:Demethylmenaquinone methyltransferase / 2-methoxy-6-polyprenyl-1,4-benzoquinol methylase n=1 Tax=Tepidibacter thalassicus DSM 15285 TaxID=1123350 RepID=A0A1M5TFN3_9FIRM|nr:class I SAM-dependent methyltransferase [Tepidibacter thalassicus]SHH49519.1 demethylmenaquinone methyltransferase / 2-methoxy-6-polyprenyl-1,4-benzoquinol methylase [Tepidibacter thalassicus DSM 15285]
MKSQIDFFNSMADKWDEIIYIDDKKINYALNQLNIKSGDTILDVGTGTGVMIPFLLNKIGKNGEILAVDIAENMLNIAKNKFRFENRVNFLKLDVELEKIEKKFNFIICYCVFPHFKNRVNTIKKLINENLKENGKLLIFHPQSKEDINKIHKDVDDIVAEDKLIDIKTQREIFAKNEIKVIEGIDNNEMYMIIIER